MSEKVEKKKGKGLKIFLIIVVIIALAVFGYIKYLDGAFNGILNKFDFSKELVIQDLDIEDKQDENQSVEEIVLNDSCNAKLLVDENNVVQVAQINKVISGNTVSTTALETAKATVKVLKGVDFDYETDADGNIKLDIRFAPGDIDESLFEKAKDLGLMNKENIDKLKSYLDNPTTDNITELINALS